MDEVWQEFNQSTGTAYVAVNENAITLCSRGDTAPEALRRMADLIAEHENPIILASSFYWEDERYYLTVVISGFEGL